MKAQVEYDAKAVRLKARKKVWSDVWRDRQLYILIIPFLAYMLVFHYFPMYGLQIAFKDFSPFKGITGSDWVGLEHFKNFFSSPYAWRTIRNTLLINLYGLAVNFTLTIIIALLLNEIRHKKFKTLVSTVIYMPHFISVVVVAGIVIAILSPTSGVINQIISFFGGEKIYFLSKPEWFRTIFTAMNGWCQIGFGTIIYTSAICSIDESLYEAAEMDGAGRFRKMWNVTLPGISHVIVVQLIMKIGAMMTVGSDAILLLYQPITYETADVISTFVYRYGIEGGQYSFATAVGLFNGGIALILVTLANKVSKKLNETSLW